MVGFLNQEEILQFMLNINFEFDYFDLKTLKMNIFKVFFIFLLKI